MKKIIVWIINFYVDINRSTFFIMSFGGPIDSMINQHKWNLRLLKERKKLKEIQSGYKAEKRPPITFQDPQSGEFSRFRQRMKVSQKKDRNRLILIIGLTLIIMLIILFWVVTTDYSGVIDVID
jgi:hypothetical protein